MNDDLSAQVYPHPTHPAHPAHPPHRAIVNAEPRLERDLAPAACPDRDFVTSLARGLAIVQAFANHRRTLTIAKISQKTGIARAAVRRYLHTLAELGYVTTLDGHGFSLSPKVLTLGNAYLSACSLPALAQQHLDALAHETGEAVSLGILDQVDMVYVARANSSAVMSSRFNVGARLPAYCTSIGHILLAELPRHELEERLSTMRFVPYTCHTIASAARLVEYLARVRENGHAIADQQFEVGFRSIAVPVSNRSGEALAGINVIVPIARTPVAQMASRYFRALRECASRLGEALEP
jgi:IclR family pca regulon transcriptional regulator